MEFSPETYELIEQFLNGQLKGEALQQFEKQLAADKALAAAVDFQKEMHAFLTDSPENELRKNLQMLSEQVVEPKKEERKGWLLGLFPAAKETNVLDWLFGQPVRQLAWVVPLLLMVGWWFTQSQTTPTASPSIAILPFEDLNPQKDQAYFGEGIAEEMLKTLAQLQEITVAGQTASFSFKNTASTTAQIGDQLKVTHVLKGSVRRENKKIRVTAELIKTEDGLHVWSDKYDSELEEIFAIQEELLQNVARVLLKNLAPELQAKLINPSPPTGAVYDLFLRAKHIHNNGYKSSYKLSDFQESEELFLAAIQMDSTYALAHAGLADLYDSYWVQIQGQEGNSDQKKYQALMAQESQLALELAPENAYVNQVRGYVLLHLKESAAAFKCLLKSYRISPNNPESCMGLSNFYMDLGLHEDALKFAEKAAAIDPLLKSAQAMRIFANFYLSRWEKTVQLCQSFLVIDPANQIAWEYLFRAYFFLNQKEQALAVLPNLTDVETLGLDLEIALLKADSSYIQDQLTSNNPNLQFTIYQYQGKTIKATSAYEQATTDYLMEASSNTNKHSSYYLDHLHNPRLKDFQALDWFQKVLAFEKEIYEYLIDNYPRASEILKH